MIQQIYPHISWHKTRGVLEQLRYIKVKLRCRQIEIRLATMEQLIVIFL